METSAEWMQVFQKVQGVLGPCLVDLFATRLNHQLPEFISWRPDPFAQGTDVVQVDWKTLKGYAFPLLLNREVHTEDSHGRMYHNTSGSVVAFTGLVPSTDGETGGVLPNWRDLLKDLLNQPHPLGTPETSCLQSIGNHHAAAGVSKKASDLLLAGWSKGTNTTYQSGWAKWIFLVW